MELGGENRWKMNYLGIERKTGALVRGYVVRKHSDNPALEEMILNNWRIVGELPLVTEVFIGTEKDF